MCKLTRIIYKMITEREEWKYQSPVLTEKNLPKLEEE